MYMSPDVEVPTQLYKMTCSRISPYLKHSTPDLAHMPQEALLHLAHWMQQRP